LGEYQPMSWQGSRRRPAGAPVQGYYPAVIERALWQKAQERIKVNPAGRASNSLVNLFTGIIFDGLSQTSMRLIQWNRGPTAAASPDQGRYLVSDYARLGKGQGSASWRYAWFEQWFLEALRRLEWSPEAGAKRQRNALEAELSQQRQKSQRCEAELSRLMQLAKSSDAPPQTLLTEMRQLEKEQATALETITALQQRVQTIEQQLDSGENDQQLIRKLAGATDKRTRLRLRCLIRKRVNRIDVFPRGDCRGAFPDASKRARLGPCFRIGFVDGVVSWVCCSCRNPAQAGAAAEFSTR
jgi:hypothetical protein